MSLAPRLMKPRKLLQCKKTVLLPIANCCARKSFIAHLPTCIGANARLSSFVGAIAIADLVKTTLGPKGKFTSYQTEECALGGGAVSNLHLRILVSFFVCPSFLVMSSSHVVFHFK